MIELIIGVFIIVMVTFGGGVVFIPMFEKLLVEDLFIVSSQEFTKAVAVANSLPGSIGAKLSAYVGFYKFGWQGLIIFTLVFVVPGIVMILIAYNFMEKLKTSYIMKKITLFIKPVVIGIFLTIIIKFLKISVSNINIVNTVIIFSISLFLLEKRVQPIYVMIFSLAYGMIFL